MEKESHIPDISNRWKPLPETADPKITEDQIRQLATANGIPYAALRAVIEVEGAGNGFDPATGKILIQFEPHWFKRLYDEWKQHQGTWASNKVGVQSVEWPAFNDAFAVDPDSAIQSTSIGMMQVMGFHYKLLGFKTVGDMWDFALVSEANQVDLGIRFIKTNKKMLNALIKGDWATFAYYYNGAGYKKFKYDIRLSAAFRKWS